MGFLHREAPAAFLLGTGRIRIHVSAGKKKADADDNQEGGLKMKTQRYIIEIEIPDGDFVGAGWIEELIESECNIEDAYRSKVSVKEIKKG